ncbi:hypothetical protein LCGC14_2190760 [marine sediment metagenome]|uniref:Uncharacterized protein n=1 Tax=marine sediment metagenome TaxID=412755 RepID=A0A0F8VCX3_9ZZZZ
MSKLSEEALTYTAPTTKNISELETVDVNADVKERTAGEGENAFTYKYIEVEGQEYRVGASVLKQLKVHLEANPNIKKFRVNKTGEGLKTEYTVIPLDPLN